MLSPPRPVLEDEANYEDLIPSLYWWSSLTPKWKTRQSAWQSQIAGTFGFTYGAQGIWWGCYTTEEPNSNCGSGTDARAWYTAIDFPVGEQMSYMAQFWTSFDWWTLMPDGNAIIWAYAPTGTQKPYQKSDGNNRTIIIAYLPIQLTGNVYNGTVRNYHLLVYILPNGSIHLMELIQLLVKDGHPQKMDYGTFQTNLPQRMIGYL